METRNRVPMRTEMIRRAMYLGYSPDQESELEYKTGRISTDAMIMV